MNTKDVLDCVLQMEKLAAEKRHDDLLVLLDDLEKHCITVEQLETTEVVKMLYRILKTCKEETVKRTVKRVLAKWKKKYSMEREHLRQTLLSEETDLRGKAEEEQEDKNSTSTTEQLSTNSSPIRSKCVQLLTSAICHQPCDHAQASTLAKDIENHLHHLHKSNQCRYKTSIRSKISNLKNPKSCHLRQGLLNGSLSPQTFAQMSAEEMASPDLQRLRREYSSQSVSERQLPQSIEGTPTRKITCKRCDGTECRVTQVSRGTLFLPAWVKQSGPDDDSMTFVTCSTCGQQWYHNNWVCL